LDLLTRIASNLNQTERILLATGLTASTGKWQSGNWSVTLSEQSRAILSIENADYPRITKFTLPAVAGISAYEIAAALGCINARTHLQMLEVPGGTVYNNIDAVDADNNLGDGFMTPLIGSSVLVNLDSENLHGQNIEKSRLVDMLERLVRSINTAERTNPLQITFPHDWVHPKSCTLAYLLGECRGPNNFQVLLRSDSMLEDFIGEYKAHMTRYAVECGVCRKPFDLHGQEDAQANEGGLGFLAQERPSCTYCFRTFCPYCLVTCEVNEFEHDWRASECTRCGVMICADCKHSQTVRCTGYRRTSAGSTVQSCNGCGRTICSLCLPNEEPAMTNCDGFNCDLYFCFDCFDSGYKIDSPGDDVMDDSDEGAGYMISCTKCNRNFCAPCMYDGDHRYLHQHYLDNRMEVASDNGM